MGFGLYLKSVIPEYNEIIKDQNKLSQYVEFYQKQHLSNYQDESGDNRDEQKGDRVVLSHKLSSC